MRWEPFAVAVCVSMGATEPALADCENRKLDGNETGVDCGGDCGPCEHGEGCRTARDCQSGRCAGYVCEERPYIEGDPIPPGYQVVYSDTDSSAILRTIGVISFGAGYAGAYVAALVLPGELSALYVPVVGPWIAVANPNQEKKGFIALDGAFQIVGASLLIGGIITGGSQLLREQPLEEAPVQISASVGRDAYQLGFSGRF